MKKICFILLLLLNLKINASNTTNLEGLESQRKYARKSIADLIVKNSQYFLNIILDQNDIKMIKWCAAYFESNLYADFLTNFDLRGCKARIGGAYIIPNEVHHFKINNTAHINERDENSQSNSNNYNPCTSSIYLNKLCNNSNGYYNIAYNKADRCLATVHPEHFFVFYIKDSNNNLIELYDDDMNAIHEKYLSIYSVCDQERKGELNPNEKAELEIDLTDYFMPNLINIYDNNYNIKNNLSENDIKLTSVIDLTNSFNISDNLGHEYVVKLYYHQKLLTTPDYWKKIQSNIFISHAIKDLPANVKIDNSNIKINEIIVVQNFTDLLFFENYKNNEKTNDITVFYACSIDNGVIQVNKYPVLRYVETLKSISRQNILKIENLKKMNELNKIDHSIAINNLIKNIKDTSNLAVLLAELQKLLAKEITDKQKLQSTLALERERQTPEIKLIEVLEEKILSHNNNISNVKKLTTLIKNQQQAPKDNFFDLLKKLQEENLQLFDSAEKKLLELKKNKIKVFPRIKCESSFMKANEYAYYEQSSPNKQMLVMRAQYKKAHMLYNQTERFINENFQEIIKTDPEIDCIINEDEEGNLTYYFKSEDQTRTDLTLKYTL